MQFNFPLFAILTYSILNTGIKLVKHVLLSLAFMFLEQGNYRCHTKQYVLLEMIFEVIKASLPIKKWY